MTMRYLAVLFAAIVMLSGTACTTTSHYSGTDRGALQTSISPGDRVLITELDGTEYELIVEAVTRGSLVGERAYLGRVEVPFADITEVTLEKAAPLKTAGAVVGGTVIAVVAGAVVVAAAMSGDLAPTY